MSLPFCEASRLIQRETLAVHGILKPLAPIIARMLALRLRARLEAIKVVLEPCS
jgi:hypothetical protein